MKKAGYMYLYNAINDQICSIKVSGNHANYVYNWLLYGDGVSHQGTYIELNGKYYDKHNMELLMDILYKS